MEQMNEKKLTPNELKKREEIAKSMEKENPDMPMDKKMAIATSVAKRVAEGESTEEISEDFTKMDTPTLKKWINTRQRNSMGSNLSKQRRDQYASAEAEMKKRHNATTNEDVHYCAKHVFSERFGNGVVVEGSHAEPDANGLIEWYDVDFGGTVRRIMTEKVRVMQAEYHMNHQKKMKEADDHTVPKTPKEKDLAAAAYPYDKITHKDVLVKRGVVKEEDLVEFVVGTKVHHPYLGAKGGEVVKPESNGFNVKTHDNHVSVKASNGKIYKFAAHSLKRSTSDAEAEKMKPLTMNRLRKEDVVDLILNNIKNNPILESKPKQNLSFKEFSEVYEDVILENSPFGASQLSWLSKKGDEPAKSSSEKKSVGRPKGDYGSYKIDPKKRQDPKYKEELSAKVRAAKADGFAARKEFKDLMNAAIKKREQELYGDKNND